MLAERRDREYVRVHVSWGVIALRGEDLCRFNRLLIEDAYPGAGARIYQLRTKAIVDTLHTRPRAALCLSGGGDRAMLFHLGVLWRLNEAGLLRASKRVSSVSGGSTVIVER